MRGPQGGDAHLSRRWSAVDYCSSRISVGDNCDNGCALWLHTVDVTVNYSTAVRSLNATFNLYDGFTSEVRMFAQTISSDGKVSLVLPTT